MVVFSKKRFVRLISAGGLLVLWSPASVAQASAAEQAAPSSLQAGFARADITPDVGMFNWTRPNARTYGEVHDPIFARALVLSDGTTRVALIGWDLLDAREFAVARVRTAVSQATGIPPAHIVIHATHNHSGPKSEMGPETLLKPERVASRAAQEGPFYRAWADRLVALCVELVRTADAEKQTVRLGIARAWVGEWTFNRRPLRPDQTVRSMLSPKDPYVLGDGLRFGVVDPTMTILSLRAAGGRNVCTLFHLPMHAVAVYGATAGISADWPGRVSELLQQRLGGGAMFLQGCAGDIVPARRGFAAVDAMGTLIADRAVAAFKVAAKLDAPRIRISRTSVALATTEAAAKDLERSNVDAEITLITAGDLALVTLPGEPLQEIGTAIQQRSPYPHTIVLGYTNGRGVGYVGLPGGKARGGYEMTEVGAGRDDAGERLVDAAAQLLRTHETAAAPRPAGEARRR